MAYDQSKRCPRCQRTAPELRTIKLQTCLYCDFPGADPRYDDLAAARAVVLEQTNKRQR